MRKNTLKVLFRSGWPLDAMDEGRKRCVMEISEKVVCVCSQDTILVRKKPRSRFHYRRWLLTPRSHVYQLPNTVITYLLGRLLCCFPFYLFLVEVGGGKSEVWDGMCTTMLIKKTDGGRGMI